MFLSSDHRLVLLTLNLNYTSFPRPPFLTPGPMEFLVLLEPRINIHIPLKTPSGLGSTVFSYVFNKNVLNVNVKF
jgi:hypothetical protein